MTNHVSLYIAAGSDLQHVRNLAKRELAGARNVKSDWTRVEVTAAWRNILVYLSGLRTVPTNGVVLFASSDGVDVVEPPVPCRTSIYRCGTAFERGPLDALYDDAAGEKTGLILIDNNEATIAWYRGKTISPLWHDYSGIMGKHGMGGQSQRRFERGHAEQVKQWQRKVSELANDYFIPLGITKVLVGGPGWRKHALVEDGKLDYRLTVIATVDCEYVDDIAGPREALARWKATNL
jgi:peptide chain release factor subunit 1